MSAKVQIIDVERNRVIDEIYLPAEEEKLRRLKKPAFLRVEPEGLNNPFFYTLSSNEDIKNLLWMIKWAVKHPDKGIIREETEDEGYKIGDN